MTNEQKAAYGAIDRFLRNNLNDDDYADYSKSLDALASSTTEPVAWINKQGDYVELSTKSTVYGSHTIPLYPPPQPVIAPEPQEPALDRAAEWGEYIAKAAENLLRATENLALADIRYAETGDDHGVEDAEDAVSEFSRSLTSKIYEFRKRVKQGPLNVLDGASVSHEP